MVSKEIFYESKNKQEGLLFNAEIVYPVDEHIIKPMSEIGGGLYKAVFQFNDNTTYIIKIDGKHKLYAIGDPPQLTDDFVEIKNKSSINIFVFNIINRKEIGEHLKPGDSKLISLLAYKLQKDDNIFRNYVEIIG